MLEQTVQLRRRLVSAGQGDQSYQRQLGVSLERLADNLSAQGRSADALPLYQERRDIAVSLAKADPLDTGLQTDLITAREKLAGALESQKAWKEALVLRGEIVRSCENRAEATPDDTLSRVALAGAHYHHARLCLMSGDPALVKTASAALDRAHEVLSILANAGVLDDAGRQLQTSVETARTALAKALSGG
ncbi:MAG: hypothetical protein U0984_12465 [Prosthecobacter sp.]|nr:hypothetical protein [Prosthecobacter sp.]